MAAKTKTKSKAKAKHSSSAAKGPDASERKAAIADKVANQILELLDRGELPPWEKGWHNSQAGRARNAVTNRLYRGINIWITTLTQLAKGYNDPRWMTHKQAEEMGGTVRKGEKGTQIHLAKPWVPKRERQTREEDEEERGPNGEPKKLRVIHLWRSFHVFNVEQTDGCNLAPIDIEVTKVHDPIAMAEEIIRAMPNRPVIKEYATANYPPHYSPARDTVNVPTKDRYDRVEDWYNTVFHELVHATGHWNRLGRFKENVPSSFGGHDYGREELVAGMGSAMLGEIAGIGHLVIERDAAYIKHWRDTIALDAAGDAQKAVDFMTGSDLPEREEEEKAANNTRRPKTGEPVAAGV